MVYQSVPAVDDATVTSLGQNWVTLSTANNSESDVDFTYYFTQSGASGNLALAAQATREKHLNLTAKTSYYLNVKTGLSGASNLYMLGANSKTIIRAICAYL